MGKIQKKCSNFSLFLRFFSPFFTLFSPFLSTFIDRQKKIPMKNATYPKNDPKYVKKRKYFMTTKSACKNCRSVDNKNQMVYRGEGERERGWVGSGSDGPKRALWARTERGILLLIAFQPFLAQNSLNPENGQKRIGKTLTEIGFWPLWGGKKGRQVKPHASVSEIQKTL